MSIKIGFMHYIKWTRLMLPVVFKKFELVCIFMLLFSIQYHFQLVKSILGKIWGATAPLPPSPLGF